MVYLFKKTGHAEKNSRGRSHTPPIIRAPHVPVPTIPLPDNPPNPRSPDSPGGHGKMGFETPKTPYNARFVKRGISEKPRKMPGFHRDDFVGEKPKRSSF